MKYGVIDIGSNSVRLMISIDGVTQDKFVKTTRLAEGMGTDNKLQTAPIERTAFAVSFFVQKAKECLADKIYIFATAAVRQAQNKQTFIDKVKELTDITIDVIPSELEAKLGALGALNGADGGIIDVGGASSEVLTIKNGKIIYSMSVDIGAVKIMNSCGQDKDKILRLVDEMVEKYKTIPQSKYFGIGGTATTIASISQKMKVYNPKLVHGYSLSVKEIRKMRDALLNMSIEERKNLDGLQKERAEVIVGGVALIYAILKKAGVDQITISESDNLEGYLMLRM